MHFLIDGSPSGGLRLIREIPEGALLQVEGRNGIGKTLAIRLLQLCTGEQPFLDRPQSWSTLRANLGRATIRVAGLLGGAELQFDLDSSGWPESPLPAGSWLGTATLDGAEMDWARVRQTLTVRRIGGDETLGESLAAQVARDAELVRQLEARQGRGRELWEERIEALSTVTSAVTSLNLSRLRTVSANMKKELSAAREIAEAANGRRQGALHVAALLRRIERIRADAPALEKDIERLQRQEDKLRAQVEELDRQAGQALAQGHMTKQAGTRLTREAGLQRKRYERRERRRREVAAMSEEAGLSGSATDLRAIAEVVRALEQETDRLHEQRKSVDRAGLMLEVVDAVEAPLVRGRASGLGGEVLAQVDAARVTVEALYVGLSSQRQLLESMESTDAAQLNSQIERIEARLAAARGLPDAVRLLHGAEADLQKTTHALDTTLRTLKSTDSATYKSVYESRAQHIDELTVVVEDRAHKVALLEELHAEGTIDELVERVEQIRAKVGLTSAGVASAEAAAAEAEKLPAAAEEASRRLGSAVTNHRDARREVAEAETAVRFACAQLREAGQFQWLTKGGVGLPELDAEVDLQIQLLLRLNRAAEHVTDLLLATLNDQQAIAETLAELEQRLRASGSAGALDVGRRGELTTAVEEHYQRKFADELSNDVLRSALFGGGTDISVNLLDMTVRWRLPNGQVNSRPLEAFSSGERAFAYTRVQIERLAGDTAPNRVVFLDEFGSFVAHDRFDQLKRYLRSQALGRAADQERELTTRGGYLVSELT